MIENINKAKSWLFEKINRIVKSLARLIRRGEKREGGGRGGGKKREREEGGGGKEGAGQKGGRERERNHQYHE